MSRLIGTLSPQAPYNFPLVLDILRRYAHPTLDHVRDNAYWRALHVNDGVSAGLALVRVDLSANDDLEVSLVTATGDVDDNALLADVRHILGLDIDVPPFYTYARTQPELWQVVASLEGIRSLRTASVFEGLCMTIIEQQIAWTAAQRAQRWLVEWGGHVIHYEGDPYFAFPTPEQLANATEEILTPLKITFKRMRLMIHVAQMVINGEIDLERLKSTTPQEAYDVLTSIKGVGHWTAAWTLARTQGSFAYVGHNDVALQAAVNHYFYGGTGKIPQEQVTETFDRYGEHAGLAAHYTILRWVLDRYEER